MADGNNFPWTTRQPLPIQMVGGPTSKAPFPVAASVNGKMLITNHGGVPIPVSVQRARPYLNAKNWVTQDLSKYLMFPQRIYDILPWSSASGIGATQYTFFSRSYGNGNVTLEDTNMPQANNFGQNNAFIITRIGIQFTSGILPVVTGTDAAITGASCGVNDAYRVLTRGAFQFNINGQGQFFQGLAPLTCLPPPNQFKLSGGIATGNAVADAALAYHIDGDTFSFLETPITVIGGSSFNCEILYPDGALTLPSGNNTSTLGVYLDGYFMRPGA